jgi:TatD DNase family protein
MNNFCIDTHCHLDFPDFDSDQEQVIARAKKAQVEYLINIGSSLEGSKKSIELAKKYSNIYASVGIHPHEAQKVTPGDLELVKKLADDEKVVAIGEIGLDFYKNFSPIPDQQKIFNALLHVALEKKLPVIIHNRLANDEILNIITDILGKRIKGVVHCFSGDESFLKKCLDLGFYISFTANITYPNAGNLRQLVKIVPIERILLETDAPFLPPQACRGKRNEPAYLKYLIEEIAPLKNLSGEDVMRITTHNAQSLFGLKKIEIGQGVIAYPIRDSLYLNITNRCTDNCSFCVRNYTDWVKGHNLRLDHEPNFEEIIKAIDAYKNKKFREIVFCGYGEPLTRLEILLKVSRYLKEKGFYLRLNTNGTGNLIYNRSIISELENLIDEVCVSLNLDTKEKYYQICRPQFGENTFEEIKKFIVECKKVIPKVSITFLNLPQVDLKNAQQLAQQLGLDFRIREYNVVG